MTRSSRLSALHELIAAIDRRVPRWGRAGEQAISDDAATLRGQAVGQIAAIAAETRDGSL